MAYRLTCLSHPNRLIGIKISFAYVQYLFMLDERFYRWTVSCDRPGRLTRRLRNATFAEAC